MKKGKSYKQLSYEERVKIDTLKREGKSLRYISKVLGRSPNTISLELKNNKVKNAYIPKKAEHKKYVKRYLSKRDSMKVVSDVEIQRYVHMKLNEGWSPERIAGRLTKEGKKTSTKAVYKYVYSRCLENHLFWHKHKVKHYGNNKSNFLKDERKFIDLRPEIKEGKHLEMDFIVSSSNTESLLVIENKLSRKVIIEKIPDHKQITITETLKKYCMNADTITTDNDIAFSHWKQLEVILNTKIYFTHPYCSWEKGQVENTNRWIRVPFPKKTDFQMVTIDEIKKAEHWLNNVPRKILDFKTANEVDLELEMS
jgi:IS30 family transposase